MKSHFKWAEGGTSKGNGEGVTTRAERKPGERHHRTECVLKEEGQ